MPGGVLARDESRSRHRLVSSRRMESASLRACPLFQTLSSEQLSRVAAIATRRELPGGTAIFVEGEGGDEMYEKIQGFFAMTGPFR